MRLFCNEKCFSLLKTIFFTSSHLLLLSTRREINIDILFFNCLLRLCKVFLLKVIESDKHNMKANMLVNVKTFNLWMQEIDHNPVKEKKTKYKTCKNQWWSLRKLNVYTFYFFHFFSSSSQLLRQSTFVALFFLNNKLANKDKMFLSFFFLFFLAQTFVGPFLNWKYHNKYALSIIIIPSLYIKC